MDAYIPYLNLICKNFYLSRIFNRGIVKVEDYSNLNKFIQKELDVLINMDKGIKIADIFSLHIQYISMVTNISKKLFCKSYKSYKS